MNGIIGVLAVAVAVLLVAVIGLSYSTIQILENQKNIDSRFKAIETKLDETAEKIETMPKEFQIAKEDEIARIKTWVFKLIPESLNDLWEEVNQDGKDEPESESN